MLPTKDTALWEVFIRQFDAMRLRRSQPALSQGQPTSSQGQPASNQGGIPGGRQEAPQPGGYHHGDVFFVCLVALAKWPSLLSKALSQLEEMAIDPPSATAAQWYAFMVQFCRFMHGKRVNEELHGISPGRTAAVFGLISLAKRWAILRKAEGEAPRSDGVQVVALGCLQGLYELCPEAEGIAKIGEAMEHVRRAALVFPMPALSQGVPLASSHGCPPASSQGALPHSSQLESFASSVGVLSRSLCGKGSELGTGTLARRLLSILEIRCGASIWDSCSMAVFSEVLPDMKQEATGIKEWNVADVRRRFGMSPLVISAMACLWGEVTEAQMGKVLKSGYLELLRAVEDAADPHAQPLDWAALLE